MKRWVTWSLLLWLGCAGAVQAEPPVRERTEYVRGDFRFAVGPAPAFVTAHDVAAGWDPKAPGADDTVWRVWLYDNQTDRRGGHDHDYTDYAYQVRSAASLGDAGRFQIEFSPDYQQLTLHRVALRRNGVWEDRLIPEKISLARRETDFENDLYDGRVSAMIVLDDVRVDDLVRITYTITGSNPILAGQLFDGAQVGWRSPLLDAYMRVLFDPGTHVAQHLENGARAARVATRADGVEASLASHGNPAVVDEGSYPPWYQPFPLVQVGPARTWADVVAWAMPLYPAVGALPSDLEARIDAWSRLPDPHARLRAALRVVQDEVRYFGVEMGSNSHRPTAPPETWARRYGDCKDKAYLLSTVLGRVGIEAVPALVSTGRGRALADLVPTAGAFNHVIVRARIGGETVWVDPTMTQQGGDPRQFDLSAYGVGLPVMAGATAPEQILPPKVTHDGIATNERYAPDGKDGALRLQIETTYRGAWADHMRRSVSVSRTDELQRRYAEYYRKRFGKVDALQPPVVNDDRDANTLRISESYRLEAPFVQEGSDRRGLDVFGEALDTASQLPSQMARRGPIDIGRAADYRHEISIEPPSGWRSVASEERDDFASPAFDYHRSVKRDGDSVRMLYEMKVTARDLDATAAGKHLAELRNVRENLSARLRFQTPLAPLKASERDERLKALLRGALDGAGNP